MPHTSSTTFRVRYAETDQMGVVYHANYFVWFEMGRVEFLRQLGFEYKQMEVVDDCHLPVVEATCRYKSPARYDELLTVETRLSALRSTVVRFAYRLLRPTEEGPQLLAEAETTHVAVNGKMETRPLPEKYAAPLRSALA
ncbi:acyl-CoA thioesterase [Pseudacidobacterium ailaaui]|jgi:acyl-CoA thioester hydrolase|uniref:acyl-CoA thioesterase n=1 Tax=Pseudacidobacterium ailaaui TaxID=1382359 RepID=UPI00047C1D8C|nr:thioesterase family protein [Pseudacidobacterium ailaaui]MBX6360456.1 acyl-CoA thioesterase [Pseudacidobacterium ailaaui]MCL6463761.1 acyl-CoA thioesterase [Pseudacidobacterium ailaaui]MDI3255566.1 thioesterase family protein [Bacillota bacterium]